MSTLNGLVVVEEVVVGDETMEDLVTAVKCIGVDLHYLGCLQDTCMSVTLIRTWDCFNDTINR